MPRHTRIVLLVLAVVFVYATLGPRIAASRVPGNDLGYSPEQPIAYSHRLHAGELAMPCLYCHTSAERGRHAAIPSADTCMNCHKFVTATLGATRAEADLAKSQGREPNAITSTELQKLYDALGLNEKRERDPAKEQHPIHWKRVHRLPAFAFFDHSRHVGAGVTCQSCHGPVQTMERMRQFSTLRMGWCVNCHRDVNRNGVGGKPAQASTDCIGCHY